MDDPVADKPMTPRQRLAVLREEEANRVDLPEPPPSAPVAVVLPIVTEVVIPIPQPVLDSWQVDCTGIAGGLFQWREHVVDLKPDVVQCMSATHAAALREHVGKIRQDIGLTRPPSSIHRMNA